MKTDRARRLTRNDQWFRHWMPYCFTELEVEGRKHVYLPLNRDYKRALPIRLTPMTATCRVPPLSRVKLGIGWSRGVARDAEQ